MKKKVKKSLFLYPTIIGKWWKTTMAATNKPCVSFIRKMEKFLKWGEEENYYYSRGRRVVGVRGNPYIMKIQNMFYLFLLSKKKRGFSPPYSVASCCDFSERRGNTRRIEIRKKNILFNWGKGKAKGLSALFHPFYIYFSFSGVSVIFLPPSLIENPPMEVFFYFKKGVPYGSIVSFSVRHPVFRHFVKKFPTFF